MGEKMKRKTQVSAKIRDVQQTELQAQIMTEKTPAFKKYQKLVIGNTKLGSLLKYELITLLFGNLPGALGYITRRLFYPFLFASCGKGVTFGRNMTIRHPNKIKIGDCCVFDDYSVLDAKGESNAGINIGNNVLIARNTVISCKGGDITIGDNSNISLNCMIHSESSVILGRNVLIAAYCYIIGGGTHDFDRTDIPIIQQGSTSKGIIIEENVWLAAGVKILDGSKIGKDSIIGTDSVVNKRIPDFSIALGYPAKVIKNRLKHKVTRREREETPKSQSDERQSDEGDPEKSSDDSAE